MREFSRRRFIEVSGIAFAGVLLGCAKDSSKPHRELTSNPPVEVEHTELYKRHTSEITRIIQENIDVSTDSQWDEFFAWMRTSPERDLRKRITVERYAYNKGKQALDELTGATYAISWPAPPGQNNLSDPIRISWTRGEKGLQDADTFDAYFRAKYTLNPIQRNDPNINTRNKYKDGYVLWTEFAMKDLVDRVVITPALKHGVWVEQPITYPVLDPLGKEVIEDIGFQKRDDLKKAYTTNAQVFHNGYLRLWVAK